MNHFYFFIFLFIILISCNTNTFDNKIINKIENTCKENSCLVKIKDLTNFDWENMYVFKYNATFEEISKAIGIAPPHYKEFTRKIIFTLNEKIVYFEEEKANIEGLIDNEVVFDIPDSVNFKKYTLQNAIFKTYKKEYKNGNYYEMKQIP